MKLFAALFLIVGGLSSVSQAQQIQCASGPNEMLYYSIGQILVQAQFQPQSLNLTEVGLGMKGNSVLGLKQARAQGSVQGPYLRFNLGVDSWCGYRLTFVSNMMGQEQFPAFLDSLCEHGIRSSVRLSCRWTPLNFR